MDLKIIRFLQREDFFLISFNINIPLLRTIIFHCTEKNGFVTATKLRTTNIFFVAATKNFAAATKNFAAATKRFVDRTKHFVVTRHFCYPYFYKWFCWYNKNFYTVWVTDISPSTSDSRSIILQNAKGKINFLFEKYWVLKHFSCTNRLIGGPTCFRRKFHMGLPLRTIGILWPRKANFPCIHPRSTTRAPRRRNKEQLRKI